MEIPAVLMPTILLEKALSKYPVLVIKVPSDITPSIYKLLIPILVTEDAALTDQVPPVETVSPILIFVVEIPEII